MSRIHLFQIYYSAQSQRELDPGFIPLDNFGNERPDWREYWPIRSYLLGRELAPNDYYGFPSPKFKQKTYLDSQFVLDFVRNDRERVDIFCFSPFFDQIAFYLNCVEQVVNRQRDMENIEMWRQCAEIINPHFRIDSTVGTTQNTVFCNYFVAAGGFWREWLRRCELIFALAESDEPGIGRLLNAGINHEGENVPRKVFLIERAVSIMLAGGSWLVKAHSPLRKRWSGLPVCNYRLQLVALDALKISFASSGVEEYLQAFRLMRDLTVKDLQQKGLEWH